ncbi:MAG: hypothetical protein C5B54_08400 [Acidobacteria bacterium]|nr:MAG: hypothetical protein C5B54_08400 [Acidobacteriota bacterium]
MESTKQHWESFWKQHFPDLEDRLPEYERNLVETVHRWIDVRGKKLMEVGCGSGRNSIHFAKMGAIVFVVDYSPEALAIVRTKARSEGVEIQVVEADAISLPFQNNEIDFIYHSGFLEHFPDPTRILQEQIRILKKGAYVLIDVPQKYTIYTLKKHYAMRRGTWYAGWETEYSPNQLRNLIRRQNLDIVDSYARGIALSFGWNLRKVVLKAADLYRKTRGTTGPLTPQSRAPYRQKWIQYFTDCIGIVGQKR